MAKTIRRILLVTGSRKANRNWYPLIIETLSEFRPDLIIHGNCRGVDQMCDQVAAEHGIVRTIFAVCQKDIDRYGNRAFTMRNTDMVDHLIDTYCEKNDDDELWVREGFVIGCAAFPGGSGTFDCTDKFLAARAMVQGRIEFLNRRDARVSV